MWRGRAAAGAAAFLLATAALRGEAPSIDAPRTAPDDTFDSAAALAWKQFDALWVPGTGLARATPDYDKLTPWDIGSVLAALYSARQLDLISQAEYHTRLARTLRTLLALPLYDSAVFHKLYDARTGRLIGKAGRPARTGYAYSAIDLGRLLIWLRIIERSETRYASLAGAVADRVDFARVVEEGYLHGEEVSPRRRSGIRRFQEGRIGYEQYAARGFALWGADVDPALDVTRHGLPLTVNEVELLRDDRGLDRLTSEPFVLLGMEVGWTPAESALAVNVLRVQEARWRRTKVVTMVSEDAVGIPPHYFYYYCVYCSGKAFVIETWNPGRALRSPRWVSTKAAFAWHALLPGEYTRVVLDRVGAARMKNGWTSGVLEATGEPTRGFDINTAAVILEAAAYRRLKRPFLAPRPSATAR